MAYFSVSQKSTPDSHNCGVCAKGYAHTPTIPKERDMFHKPATPTKRVGEFYTREGAAEFLDVTLGTIYSLHRDGVINDDDDGVIIDSKETLYKEEYLKQISDIAERYGVSRQHVHSRFLSLAVKPIGVDRKRKGAPNVYAESTVEKFAKILNWERDSVNPRHSQTRGS